MDLEKVLSLLDEANALLFAVRAADDETREKTRTAAAMLDKLVLEILKVKEGANND